MAISDIRLPNGQSFKIEEWLHWPLFSVVEGAANTNVNLMAFSYVVGNRVPRAGNISTGGRIATPSDTNMVVRNKINHDEAFILFSSTYEVWAIQGTNNSDSRYTNPPLDAAAVAPIFRGTNLAMMGMSMMFQVFVGTGIKKPMVQYPFSYLGQGIGAYATGSGDALTITAGGASALNLNYATGGELGPKQNQRLLNMPVFIDSDRTVKVEVNTPAGNLAVDQDWSLKLYLDGIKRRPVA